MSGSNISCSFSGALILVPAVMSISAFTTASQAGQRTRYGHARTIALLDVDERRRKLAEIDFLPHPGFGSLQHDLNRDRRITHVKCDHQLVDRGFDDR